LDDQRTWWHHRCSKGRSINIGGHHEIITGDYVQETSRANHQTARDPLQALRRAHLFTELFEGASREARSKESLRPDKKMELKTPIIPWNEFLGVLEKQRPAQAAVRSRG
jgi:hypothetical protein